MEENNPNSFDKEIENAQGANATEANSQNQENGTEQKDTVNHLEEVAPAIDLKTKLAASSREALRLLEENKQFRQMLEEKDKMAQFTPEQPIDNLYPGFEDLDEDSRNNLIAYTNQVTNRAKEELYKDPAIAFAKSSYNEKVWNDAFANISNKYPELLEKKDDFKNKYYNVNNVPVNIESILNDVAKIYLFDNAKAIGAKEEAEKTNRTEMERTNAGENTPQVSRSLEDWTRMSQENPAKFALMSKEYNNDLDSGKI